MQNVQVTLLGILIFFAGLTAGQMYHEMVGAQEALQKVDNKTYINYWKSIDNILAVRMPVAANLLILIFIANLIVFRSGFKSFPYILLVISLLCFIAETIVTVKLQLPINKQLQAIDIDSLPAGLEHLKSLTLNHFIIRSILRFTGFAILIFASFQLLMQMMKALAAA